MDLDLELEVHKFKPYKKRAIKFLDEVDTEGWRMKIYGITADSEHLPVNFILGSKNAILANLPSPAATDQRYDVGFLIIHRSPMENWFLLNWWGDENIIHQQVFSSPTNDLSKIIPVDDKSIVACVYEIEVYSFVG